MLGLYIHIPYCLQRCRYCDFATYVFDEIIPPQSYVDLLKKELSLKVKLFPQKKLHSIYFGGGTPSLLDASFILSLLKEIANSDLIISQDTEITLEINPATLNTKKIEDLLAGGVNRFSVGAQTFNDNHLAAAGRKHSSMDTRQTLDLLQELGVNYSFDLLFALPRQTLDELSFDLDIIESYSPNHLSAYCLTVPEGHPMSFQRPTEDHQIEMFQKIESRLASMNLMRYEISNFAKAGFESRHNLLYWEDHDFIGLGLSAHSYLKGLSLWGTRFWNPSSIEKYQDLILSPAKDPLKTSFSNEHSEVLSESDALFDYCHTALRLEVGLSEEKLHKKFIHGRTSALRQELNRLEKNGLMKRSPTASWQLTEKGRHMSNYVFSCLREIDKIERNPIM
jgi:oxygen-independent coproporphyrinogen III oxidase